MHSKAFFIVENCRIHKEKMVKTWNKIHPDDKVIDKKRKKN